MAVQVQTTEMGVRIDNLVKQTSIMLKPYAWKNLVDCSGEVAMKINTKTEFNRILDDDNDLRVSISVYNGGVWVHIRLWYREKPTKNGVSFYENDWNDLQKHLIPSPEMTLGVKVLTTLIRLETKMMVTQSCTGCTNSLPSQTDHECLMEAEDTARHVMDAAVKNIKPHDFILMLAQEAAKQELALEAPHDTFKRLKLFHLSSIKESVVKSDYSYS